MKPLSIEELKELKENDYFWLVNINDANKNIYISNISYTKETLPGLDFYNYSRRMKWDNYGKTWVAYKNKEQAECKGVLKSLICDIGDKVYIVNKDNTYRPIDEGIIDTIVIMKHDIIYEWNSYDYGCETIELWDGGEFTADDLGKSVFLDYEQAEQKLKELRGKK